MWKRAAIYGALLAGGSLGLQWLDYSRLARVRPFYRWPMTFAEIFPVGALVSLVSAALLRNSRFLPARPTGSTLQAAQRT